MTARKAIELVTESGERLHNVIKVYAYAFLVNQTELVKNIYMRELCYNYKVPTFFSFATE